MNYKENNVVRNQLNYIVTKHSITTIPYKVFDTQFHDEYVSCMNCTDFTMTSSGVSCDSGFKCIRG